MSLIDKVISVQGIALAALQGVSNINTYLSTFVAPEIGGIPAVSFNNTWSSLINNTIPSLLPVSRFNNTINNYLTKTGANSTYASNAYITGLSIGCNNTINNILNNAIIVNGLISNINSTLPSLLSINQFNNTISIFYKLIISTIQLIRICKLIISIIRLIRICKLIISIIRSVFLNKLIILLIQ